MLKKTKFIAIVLTISLLFTQNLSFMTFADSKDDFLKASFSPIPGGTNREYTPDGAYLRVTDTNDGSYREYWYLTPEYARSFGKIFTGYLNDDFFEDIINAIIESIDNSIVICADHMKVSPQPGESFFIKPIWSVEPWEARYVLVPKDTKRYKYRLNKDISKFIN